MRSNLVFTTVLLALEVTFLMAAMRLPEEHLNVPQLIKYWGYPVEVHRTVTEDGYHLTMHRIPYGEPEHVHKKSTKKKPLVFLQHGLLCSSSNWVINQPRESLGFMLANAGYDVWMGNTRGNTYSTKHSTLSANSTEFWDFTFDEMAKYDLPAMVTYALKHSGQSSLYYVGHSQGTMMAFAGLSESKALREQIKVVFALAPVARLTFTESPIKYLSYFEFAFSGLLGSKDFMPSHSWMNYVAEKICPYEESLCGNVLFLLAGFDRKNLNESREAVYLAHTPAGTSVKNMRHFSQLIQEKRFQKYDYGFLKNVLTYGSRYPTVYNLKTFSTPVMLISGSNDWLADTNDVKWLASELNHVVQSQVVQGYNHLDFIWGMKARSKVYKSIIKTMRKYEKQEGELST